MLLLYSVLLEYYMVHNFIVIVVFIIITYRGMLCFIFIVYKYSISVGSCVFVVPTKRM